MSYKNNLLYIYMMTIIFLISHTTCQLNETNATSTPETTTPDSTQIYTSFVDTLTTSPTQEPTIEPTYMPTEYPTTQIPTINPTIEPTIYMITEDTSEEIIVEVTITITIDYGNSTITASDITKILSAILSEELPNVKIQHFPPPTIDIESDNEISITYTMELIAYSENEAKLIKNTIESEEFEEDLEFDIEAFNNNYNVNNIESEAIIIDDENNTNGKITWLDPTTYGLLNWIIIGAILCILCIFCLFVCRCCYLCCNKTRRMRRAKSGYQVGKPMFGAMDPNTDADSAFQSDLRQAIEMNNQKKLLKGVDSVGTLNIDEVNAAFDQDFDEIKPINKTTNVKNIRKVSSASDKENNENNNEDNDAHSDDEKKEPIQKKTTVGSEGRIKSNTIGDTLIPTVTPGGPNNNTPGGPNNNTPGGDDDNAPPPPKPPTKEDVQKMDEYDLL